MLMVLTLFFGYRGKRPTLVRMLRAIIDTGRVSLDIILIGAAAGHHGRHHEHLRPRLRHDAAAAWRCRATTSSCCCC